MCDITFVNNCESFQRIFQIDDSHSLDAKLLLPFLYTPLQSHNTEDIRLTATNTTTSNDNELRGDNESFETVYTKAVCRAKLDTLADWCESRSVNDLFWCRTRRDCRSREQASLVDCFPIESGRSEQPVQSELCSSLDVASVNFARVQFATRLSMIDGETCGINDEKLVLDVPHLISTNRKDER